MVLWRKYRKAINASGAHSVTGSSRENEHLHVRWPHKNLGLTREAAHRGLFCWEKSRDKARGGMLREQSKGAWGCLGYGQIQGKNSNI